MLGIMVWLGMKFGLDQVWYKGQISRTPFGVWFLSWCQGQWHHGMWHIRRRWSDPFTKTSRNVCDFLTNYGLLVATIVSKCRLRKARKAPLLMARKKAPNLCKFWFISRMKAMCTYSFINRWQSACLGLSSLIFIYLLSFICKFSSLLMFYY